MYAFPAMRPTARQTTDWFIIPYMGWIKDQADVVYLSWALSTLFLTGFVACNFSANAPETMARNFIQVLVTTPGDTEKLKKIANTAVNKHPEDLIDSLSARVALEYLGAKHAQGVALTFSQKDLRRLQANQQVVTIRVSYSKSAITAKGEIRFRVYFENNDQGKWQIVRVAGDS